MLSDPAHHRESSGSDEPPEAAIPEITAWFQRRDVGVAAMVMVLGLAGWMLPESSWPGWARRVAARRLKRSARLAPDELATIKVIVGNSSSTWIEQTFRPDWLAHKYHSWIQLLACYWPRRWQPQPRLIGRHHLDAALAQGRGAILFTANFVYKDLMTKAAFAGAGYQVSHLCRDSHGFGDSGLCRRVLNPIYTCIEQRFLRESLVFSGNRTKQVNAMIRARLKDNRPIMVTVTPLGRRIGVLPFLHGRIRIATGALNFACELGSPVLPVFTIRKPDGTVETIVEHALEMRSDLTRSEMIDVMLQDYVPRLETYVAQYPDQFAFPTSNRHGEAVIEPWSPPTKPKAVMPARDKEAVPELV